MTDCLIPMGYHMRVNLHAGGKLYALPCAVSPLRLRAALFFDPCSLRTVGIVNAFIIFVRRLPLHKAVETVPSSLWVNKKPRANPSLRDDSLMMRCLLPFMMTSPSDLTKGGI